MLVVASLVSMLTVFAYADDDQSATTEIKPDDIELFYNRNFEEGWDVSNGLILQTTKHSIVLDYEEAADSSYNYFVRYTLGNDTVATTAELTTDKNYAKEGLTIFKFDIMADDAFDVGQILKVKTDSSATDQISLLYLKPDGLYAFSGANDNKLADISNDWTTVTLVFDWNDETKFKCTAYSESGAVVSYEQDYTMKDGAAVGGGIQSLYIGFCDKVSEEDAANRDGKGFCLDNMEFYQSPKITGPIDLSKLLFSDTAKYGTRVDSLAKKTVRIYKDTSDKTIAQILKDAISMKVGVTTALYGDYKADISDYCAPTVVDGKVMIPVQAFLDFIGLPIYMHPDKQSFDITTGSTATYLTLGRKSATVDGKLVSLEVAPGFIKNAAGEDVLVISIDDIDDIFPGYAVTYDKMGLIIIHEASYGADGELVPVVTRKENLPEMLELMKKFVFATVDTDRVDDSYYATGYKVYEDVKAATTVKDGETETSFNHPYIYTNQAGFDKLNTVYTADDGDATAKLYIAKMLDKADKVFADTAEVDANSGAYLGIKEGKAPFNPFFDGKNPDVYPGTVKDTDDGYNDASNDLYEIEAYTENLVYLALAYQVTRNDKYALLAYDYTIAFNEWKHWAPGYFVNCATAAQNIAISYDWLYNAYVRLEKDVDAIAQMIYDKAITQGYNSVTGEFCDYPRSEGYGDQYNTRADSWNSIGTAGMVIASLVVMDYADRVGNYDYMQKMFYLVGNSLINLGENGLDWYAPDGAYIESTTYWAKATNALMQLVMALDSAAGTDYGFAGTWGLESTFYFALQMENADGEDWNYHEDGAGSVAGADVPGVDTQIFFFAGKALGDDKLIAIRQKQLANNKKEVSLYDVLFYPYDGVSADTTLELDYYGEGNDSFISRDSWESGALYTGIMAGMNGYTPYTDSSAGSDIVGHIDSGNFIYQNKGVDWIIDLGSDYYTSYSYFGAYRYRFYRNSGEGNNVLVLTSQEGAVPYGQRADSAGDIYDVFIDPNGKGGYALIDNSSVYFYDSLYPVTAYRGMLVTNDKKTVVIQDEVGFGKFEAATWIAHTAEKIQLDASGKVAYISKSVDGMELILRATLVSSGAYTFSLDRDDKGNLTKNVLNSTTNSGTEKSRDGITRLLINTGDTIGFSAAVVFEIVPYLGYADGVGYTWVDMNRWNTLFTESEDSSDIVRRGTPVRSSITGDSNDAGFLLDEDLAFTTELEKFYIHLANIAYTLKTFTPETFIADDATLASAYENYLDYLEEYEEYMEYINDYVDNVKDIVKILEGR